MMKIYRTKDKQLTRVEDMGEGSWVCLTAPTEAEVRQVAATLDIEPSDLFAATDPEESARISLEDGYTVIIVDIPYQVPGSGEGIYSTIPMGILLTQDLVVTVCSVETPVIGDFASCRVRGFSTRKKMRFVYQLLYRAATMYQQELRLIDRRRQALEKNLSGDLRDSDLVELHGTDRFSLRGRRADLLEVAGKRASLGELTRQLLAIPGVEDGVVVQLDEEGAGGVRRIAAVAVAPTLGERAILDALRRVVDPVFLPRRLRLVPALPRNETGKLPRSALLQLLAAAD